MAGNAHVGYRGDPIARQVDPKVVPSTMGPQS